MLRKLKKKNKNISLIVANNVIAHVLDINNFIKSLSILCSQDTILSIEFPHVVNLFKKLGYTTMDDWYKIKLQKVMDNNGNGLIKRYNSSCIKLLTSVYPDYNWIIWKFLIIK